MRAVTQRERLLEELKQVLEQRIDLCIGALRNMNPTMLTGILKSFSDVNLETTALTGLAKDLVLLHSKASFLELHLIKELTKEMENEQ